MKSRSFVSFTPSARFCAAVTVPSLALLLTVPVVRAEPRAYEKAPSQAAVPGTEAGQIPVPAQPEPKAPPLIEAPPEQPPEPRQTGPRPAKDAQPCSPNPSSDRPRNFQEGLEAESCKQAPESVPAIGPRHDGSNYFLVNARDFRGNETGVVKFRIDLEYDLVRLENHPQAGYFYFTLPFRLVSFWDLFDKVPGASSAPFLETNYAPGLEIGWVLPTKALATDSEDTIKAERHALTLGVLHESNGIGTVGNSFVDSLKDSRSWNRWYLTGRLALIDRPGVLVTSSLTAWYPWGSDIVDGWPDGSAAQTRLQEYLGYGELLMRARVHLSPWFDFGLRAVARQHSVEAELRWSIKRAQLLDRFAVHGNGFRVDLVFLCFSGRGERLMVANELHTSCYAGLGL